MPDLTSAQQTPSSVTERQDRVTSSVESHNNKARHQQVTSAIKIPKVFIKSLHRKPERLHHNHHQHKVSKYHTSSGSGGSSSKKHYHRQKNGSFNTSSSSSKYHTSNSSGSCSKSIHRTYSQQSSSSYASTAAATASRGSCRTPSTRVRREESRRVVGEGGDRRDDSERVRERREEREGGEGVVVDWREEREAVPERPREEREGVTSSIRRTSREERQSNGGEHEEQQQQQQEVVVVVETEAQGEQQQQQEEEEGRGGVMNRAIPIPGVEQATPSSLLHGYKRDVFSTMPRLHPSTSHHLAPPPPFPILAPSPLPHSPTPDSYLEDLLNCPVCMEEYTPGGKGGRQPFFLSCHHSLCGMCLSKLTKTHHHSKDMREVSCPECREVTLVPPAGLTQNFYLVSLLETRAARLRRQPTSSRLRMWCGTCDSVALEGCSSHALTHLTSVLATSTSTFSSTSARLSALLQRRAGEQGEAARCLREAVVVLDAASKSLKGQLEAKLETSTLAHATAVSLLTEVDQMSNRVGNELRKETTAASHKHNNDSTHNNNNNNNYKSLNRALSTPGVTTTKEGVTLGRKHRKSRSDLTDLVVTLNSGGIYPALTDDLNLESTCFPSTNTSHSSSSSTPSSPSLPSSSSSRYSTSIPPPTTPYSTTAISLPPALSSSSTVTSPPLPSTSALNSAPFPPFFPSKSLSLGSTPTSTPPTSPYLSAPSSTTPSLDALTCHEQEAKILLLRKCVQVLEGMEAALMDGCDDGKNAQRSRKEGGGGGKGAGSHNEGGSNTEGGGGGGSVRTEEGHLTKEALMEMFKKAVDALD